MGDLQLFSFTPKTFDLLAGKGRTFFSEITALLDLSGTQSFNSKSGRVVLFSSGTLSVFNSVYFVICIANNSHKEYKFISLNVQYDHRLGRYIIELLVLNCQ